MYLGDRMKSTDLTRTRTKVSSFILIVVHPLCSAREAVNLSGFSVLVPLRWTSKLWESAAGQCWSGLDWVCRSSRLKGRLSLLSDCQCASGF